MGRLPELAVEGEEVLDVGLHGGRGGAGGFERGGRGGQEVVGRGMRGRGGHVGWCVVKGVGFCRWLGSNFRHIYMSKKDLKINVCDK